MMVCLRTPLRELFSRSQRRLKTFCAWDVGPVVLKVLLTCACAGTAVMLTMPARVAARIVRRVGVTGCETDNDDVGWVRQRFMACGFLSEGNRFVVTLPS